MFDGVWTYWRANIEDAVRPDEKNPLYPLLADMYKLAL